MAQQEQNAGAETGRPGAQQWRTLQRSAFPPQTQPRLNHRAWAAARRLHMHPDEEMSQEALDNLCEHYLEENFNCRCVLGRRVLGQECCGAGVCWGMRIVSGVCGGG